MTSKVQSLVSGLVGGLLLCVSLGAGVALGWGVNALRANRYAQERQSVESLQPDDKLKLLAKQQRFAEQPPEEQERLRHLCRELESRPDAEQLRTVMVRYYDWLKTISVTQRGELTDPRLSIDERVATIKSLQQEKKRRSPLDSDDMTVLAEWLESQIQPKIPADLQERLKTIRDPLWRRQDLLWNLAVRFQGWGRRETPVMIMADDVKLLADRLSPSARKTLLAEGELRSQQKLIGSWLHFSFQKLSYQNMQRLMHDISAEQLAHFFDSELDAQRREELQRLPDDVRAYRLRWFYLQEKHPERLPFPPGSFGSGRGPRPGGGPGGRPDGGPNGPPNRRPPFDGQGPRLDRDSRGDAR
jgi:hypothetical protein